MKTSWVKCFRSSLSSANPRISPLAAKYKCPQPFLFIISQCQVNQQNKTRVLFYYSMLTHSGAKAYFEHSDLLMVIRLVRKGSQPKPTTLLTRLYHRTDHPIQLNEEPAGPIPGVNSTTDVLTATTLIYAFGAGITAAAGTRLALQLILVKGFKLYSFQLLGQKAQHCYLLSLPPRIGIG